VRHVKGSHIVVPRVHSGSHAYILQNADKRIVFVIPYQEKFSLIGTTDIQVEEYEKPRITAEEVDYLCEIASAYLTRELTAADVVWTYSGVRPLYDDGSVDPSAVTRDYVLKLDQGEGSEAPLLSIFGGKITTYRRLAETALSELAAFFPNMGRPWTRREPLPGGDVPRGDVNAYGRELAARYPGVSVDVREALLHRHGTRAPRILGDARTTADLGAHFGHSLYAAEVDYFVAHEWARAAEDVLWRRTKCGLHLTAAQREVVSKYLLEQYGYR
jgi:glycerol-3-phosphate dehydrogenase